MFIAIDPASLVLCGRLLDAYYVTQDPHVPVSDTLEDVIRQATKAERAAVAARARFLKELGSVVEEVLARIEDEAVQRQAASDLLDRAGFSPRPSSSTPRLMASPHHRRYLRPPPSRGTKANYSRNNSTGR
jgi:hypothetical protein